MAARKRLTKPAPDYGQLEDRVLLSAAPIAAALAGAEPAVDSQESGAAAMADQAAMLAHDSNSTTDSANDQQAFRLESSDDTQQLRRELVVIDQSAEDYQQLVDDLLSQESDSRQFEIALLDSDRDGIEQISELLRGYDQLDAVHIVSHGTDGAVKLGNSWLSLDNVGGYAGQLVGWRDALAADADLLFYGCDLASNEDGKTLVESLSTLCDCDVAASEDLTGHAALGGDWDLEFAIGGIETVTAFSAEAQRNWQGLLAVVTVDTAADELDGDTSSIANLIITPGGTGISLREAITAANADSGITDTINFNIGGGGLQTIMVGAGGLPAIEDPVNLDATTQPGYSGNPLIELDGTGAAGATAGILLWTDDSTVQGFIVHSFPDEGIEVDGSNPGGSADNNIIINNWVGIDSTGSAAPNGDIGILITDAATNNRIGGTGVNDGNVVSGNTNAGIVVRDPGSDGTIIQGNLIGLSTDGLSDIANGTNGIEIITSADGTQIGGTAAGAGNVISGNTIDGILLDNSTNTTIEGNYIGTNAAGTAPVANGDDGVDIKNGATGNTIGGNTAAHRNIISGNTADGVYLESVGNTIIGNYIGTDVTGTVDLGNNNSGLRAWDGGNNNTIGTTNAGEGNLIAFNNRDGVEIQGTATGNSIRGNAIHSNDQVGIDLNSDNVTLNDVGDADAGPNALQNFPVLSQAVTDGSNISIAGTLNSTASTNYVIDFYASTTQDGSGYGEAERYLGSTNATTDGSGNAAFSATLASAVAAGEFVTATATVDLGGSYGDTSEFAANVTAVAGSLVVTTTNDTINGDVSSVAALVMSDGGDGISLREAITAANATDGTDYVTFNIGGGGLQTIVVGATVLPTITDTLILDATSQLGYAGNPLIQLDGTATTGSANGLTIATITNNSTIKGFIVHSFADEGIEVLGNNNTIQNNWVGIDDTGSADPNGDVGIILAFAAANNLIGGTGANDGNVVSGNTTAGIVFRDAGTDNNTVQGNLIGVAPDGVTPVANGGDGVILMTAVANNTIGGTAAGEANIIAHNTLDGVSVNSDAGTGNAIVGNEIFSNTGLGVDLNTDGVTANDANDVDAGANNLQNFPVLTSATVTGLDITIDGTLNSTPSTVGIVIHFYWSSVGDGSGYGEAENYIGSTTVNTDISGNAVFSAPFIAAAVPAGSEITASATDPSDNTSEFALNVTAVNSNVAPTLTLPGGPLSYTENDPATVIDGGATLSDPDSTDFDTGTLTIDFTANGTANDRLEIRDQGPGVGNISLLGSDVRYDFGVGPIVIGTFAGGTGVVPLVITLNAASDDPSVEALMRNITYRNVSDDPSTLSRTARFVLTDGDGGTSNAETEIINVAAAPGALLLSTKNDVSGGGQPGTDTWEAGDLIEMDDPNLAFEKTAPPQDTDGTFGVTLDMDLFSAGASTFATHYVTRDIQLGTSNFQLLAGDVLVAFEAGATLTSGSTPSAPGFTNNLSVTAKDVFVLRPDTPGDYSAATFAMLLESPTGANIAAVSLIEQNTTVGDTVVEAGDFILADSANARDVGLWETTDVGAASTSGTYSTLLAGIDANVNLTADIHGLDLVESDITVGGRALNEGDILVNLKAARNVGQNNLPVTMYDVFAMDVTATTLIAGPGNGQVTASAFFEGADVAFDSAPEQLWAFTLTVGPDMNADPAITLPGGPVSYTENDPATVIDGGATLSDADSTDFDTGTLTVDYTANGTANDRLEINDEGPGVGNISLSGSDVRYDFGAGPVVIGTYAGGTGLTPLVITLNANSDDPSVEALMQNITYRNVSANPATASRTVRFVLTDGDGGTSSAETEIINVNSLGDSLILSTTGNVGSPSGAPGLDSWSDGEALEFGDANWTAEPGITDGTFSSFFDIDTFTVDGDANVNALHYVNKNIVVGGGGNTEALHVGDLLLSTNAVETVSPDGTAIHPGAITVNPYDVFVFRPDTAGDYSSGTFIFLLDDISAGNDVVAISLVEQDTLFGDIILQEGSFLYGVASGGAKRDVIEFDPTGVGQGTTTGTTTTIIAGDEIEIGPGSIGIGGFHLVQDPVTLGGASLSSGDLIVTLTLDDGSVGDNMIAVTDDDFFYFDVTATTAGAGTAAATATLLFEGVDVGLSDPSENPDAVSLFLTNPTGNTAPTITLPGGPVSYTENDLATIIDAAATLIDADSPDFDGGQLRVELTANGTTNDRLEINDEGPGIGNISLSGSNVRYDFGAGPIVIGTFSGGTGLTPLVITLNASSDDPSVEALMQKITYRNVSEDPSTLSRTVRFVLTDGDGGTSNAETETINVAAANDPSVLAAIEAAPLAYTENAAATAITSTITVGDVDDTNIEGATIQITGNYASGQDLLAFVDIGPITGSWVALTGTMTLSGTDTLANYEAALRTVTYQNTSDDPSALVRTVSFAVNDGDDPSNTVTRNINVTAVNDAPTITNLAADALAYTEGDGAVVVEQGGDELTADVDSTNFDTGNLTVGVPVGNDPAEDVLSIRNQGILPGQIGFAAGNVTYGGVLIGTAAGGSGGVDLVVTFGTNATPTTVTALIQNVTFEDTDTLAPTLGARTVRFTVNDGDGDTSLTHDATVTVAAANDPSALAAIEGAPLAYTENAAATAITSTITVSDVDDTNIEGATIQITGNYANGQDLLAFVDIGPITGSWVALTGTLTLSGTDTLANYQAALRTVTYQNTSDDPSTLVRTVSFTVNDGDDPSNTVARNINVTAVNDAPTITNLAGDALAYTEGDGAVVVEQGLDAVVADVDSTNFDTGNLTVGVPVGNDPAEDVLSIRNQGILPGQIGFAAGNVTYGGVLIGTAAGGSGGADLMVTFNASATPTAVTALIQNITFEDTDTLAPTLGARTVRFTVNDGDGDTSLTHDATVTVAAANDPSVLAAIEGAPLAYTENAAATAITSTITVSDVDDTNIEGATIQITGNYANGQDLLAFVDIGPITGSWVALTGTLTLSGTDTLANYQAALRTVTYQNTSDDPSTLVRTVSFTVNDGDDPSNTVARNINVTAVNDAPTITNLAGDALAYTEGDGAVVVEQGLDAVVADVDSTNFDTGNLTVGVPVGNDPAEDVLSIRNQGILPGQIGFAAGNVTYGGVLIGTAAGGSGGADLMVTFNASATPTAVTALIQNITFEDTDTLAPTLGARTVRFTVNDGDGDTSLTHDATVTVAAANDPSVLAAIEGAPLAYTENAAATAITSTITVSDVDDTNIEGATIQITGNYANGQDLLAFVDIGPITGSWVALTGTLTLSGTDTLANYEAALRTVTYQNTSDDPSTLVRTVSFTVNDGDDPSNTVARNINVTAVNDAPTITNLAGDVLAYTEGDGAVVVEQGGDELTADVDSTNFDTGKLTVGVPVGNDPAEDVLSIRNQGILPGQIGFAAGNVTYGGVLIGTAVGGSGGADLVVTFNANATPTAVTALIQNVTFEDTDTLAPTLGARTVRFTVNDGDGDTSLTHDATVTVSAANDPSVLAAIEAAPLAYIENDPATAITGTLTVGDVDDANIESATIQITGNYAAGQDLLAFTNMGPITGSWNAISGTMTLTGSDTLAGYQAALRTVTYQNTSDDPSALARTVSFTVHDGDDPSNTVTRNINVSAVNDAPVAAAESFSVANDATLNVPAPGVLVNDTDAEGDPLSAVLVSGPASGSLTFNPDGSFSYTPLSTFDGAVSFTYRATDGVTPGNIVVVTINVTGSLGPPPDSDPPDSDPPPDDDDNSDSEKEVASVSLVTGTTSSVVPTSIRDSRSDPSGGGSDEMGVPIAIVPLEDPSGVEDFVFFDTIQEELPKRIRKAIEELSALAPQLVAYVDPQLLWERLDEFEDGLRNDDETITFTVGSVAITSLALTAGYVFWTIKGGYLLASVLSQMPAWKFMDPLPIYDAVAGGYWEDQEEEEKDLGLN